MFAAAAAFALVFSPVLPAAESRRAAEAFAEPAPDPFCFDDADLINVSASAAVLMEAESGRVIFSKDPHKMLPMASTTKIMTCLLACELLDPERPVTVTKETVDIEGSSVYLTEGEVLTVKELLYCAMLRSGNDAARTLAKECGGSVENFVAMMNLRAKAMGLTRTHFANPEGLPAPGHYTTAYDLARLTAAALKNSVFAEVCATQSVTVCGGKRTLVNRNRLMPVYSGMIGVKTGYTPEAGHCLVTAAERGGVRLVAVTLCDNDRWSDHRRLLDTGFSELEERLLFEPGALCAVIPVAGTDGKTLRFSNAEDVRASLPPNVAVTYTLQKPAFVYAPVSEGDTLCRALIYADGHLIAYVPLRAETGAHAERQNLFERLTN